MTDNKAIPENLFVIGLCKKFTLNINDTFKFAILTYIRSKISLARLPNL